MTLGLLCNNLDLAFPALQWLAGQQVPVAVGADGRNTDLIAQLQPFCTAAGFSFTVFDNADFGGQLLSWLCTATPDAVLMMTFPVLIPAAALTIPRHGFINFHYGLLPQYRGANPIFEQIRRQEPFGGITVHRAASGIDTGPVIAQQQLPIAPGETFGIHLSRLAILGVQMLAALMPALLQAGPLTATPQDASAARYFKAPAPGDVAVCWQHRPEAIAALADACNPWNHGAAARLKGAMIGIASASVYPDAAVSPGTRPGTILSIDPRQGLIVATADGTALRIDIVYINASFIPGYKLDLFGIRPGDAFE